MAKSRSRKPEGRWQRISQAWQVGMYWCAGIAAVLVVLGMALDYAVFPIQPPTQAGLRSVKGRLADTFLRSAYTKTTSASNYEFRLEHNDQVYFVPPSVFPLFQRTQFETHVHPGDQVTLWVADVVEKPIDSTGWVLSFFRFAGKNWPGVLGVDAGNVNFLSIDAALAAEAAGQGEQHVVVWVLLGLAAAVPVVLGLAWLFGRNKQQPLPRG